MEPLFGKKVKRIADSSISNKDIHEVVRQLGSSNSAARHELEKMMRHDQAGGLTKEEFHGRIQELIASGKLSKSKGREFSKQMGLSDRFLKYKDYSESLDLQKREDRREIEEARIEQNIKLSSEHSNDVSAPREKANGVKEAESGWDIINKQRHI